MMKPGSILVFVSDYRLDQCGSVEGLLGYQAEAERIRIGSNPSLPDPPKIVSVEAIPKIICIIAGTFSRIYLTHILGKCHNNP